MFINLFVSIYLYSFSRSLSLIQFQQKTVWRPFAKHLLLLVLPKLVPKLFSRAKFFAWSNFFGSGNIKIKM